MFPVQGERPAGITLKPKPMKRFIFFVALIPFLWLGSCNNEGENLAVWNLQVACVIDDLDSIGNLVHCTAIANNAKSFTWDLGFETDTAVTGMVIDVRFPVYHDTTYLVKCTATGLDNVSTMSVVDTVKFQ